jgi:hypothetical protein
VAATVDLYERFNGAPGTVKTSTSIRFKHAANATVDAVNPMVKPAAGSNRSYHKYLRLRIGSTGPTGEITNPQLYTDGSNNYGTGILLWILTTNGAYSTPAADAPNDASCSDIFTYTSGSRKDMDTANPGPFTGTNVDIADYARLHMAVDSTASAPQNPTSSEIITYTWDET